MAENITVVELQDRISGFLTARPSMDDHNRIPGLLETNLALEAAEVLELHKMRSLFTDREYAHELGGELSDVLFYLLTFAYVYDIDLGGELLKKLKANEERFPAEEFAGNRDNFAQQYWARKITNGERKEYGKRPTD